MSNERHTHERYRGGGRESHDRRHRQNQFNSAERWTERTNNRGRGRSGTSGTSGATRPNQAESTRHHDQPERRYASTNPGKRPDEPQLAPDATGDRPTNRADHYPGLGHGQSIDRKGQGRPEILAGGPHSSESHQLPAGPFPQPERQRETDERIWTGESSPQTGGQYRQRYGQPVGQASSGHQAQDGPVGQHRPTHVDRRFPTGGHDTHRGSGTSGGRSGQPRDPETGRFLSKDEADGEK